MLLINLYNQAGAGPKNISLNLISELRNLDDANGHFFVIVPNIAEYKILDSSDSVNIIKLPRFNNLLLLILFRLYLDFIYIPQLIKTHNIKSLLAFGNYLLTPVRIKKIVLLHHPYLVDDVLFNKLPLLLKSVEALKRFAFWLTLKNVDTVVVQSSFVFEQFKRKFRGFKKDIKLIANPISKNFSCSSTKDIDELVSNRVSTMGKETTMLYVSRFYPHKNHEFLIKLSSYLSVIGVSHKIFITVDACLPEALKFLQAIKAQKASIVNLGEITQQELEPYYQRSHIFIFPSRPETFGNSLIEAISFALPVIAPSLAYSSSILDTSGIYYTEDDVEDFARKVESIVNNVLLYREKSYQSYKQFALYQTSTLWANEYINLAFDEVVK